MGRTAAHLDALKEKHYNLELEINKAVHTRKPTEVITKLKKEKLRVKEEIENLKNQLASTGS